MQPDPTQNAPAAAPASEALRDGEDKYRHLFENLNDAALLGDADTGVILDANRQAEALFGRPRDEIVGIHQTELHPPGKADEYRLRFRAHVAGGRTADYDGEIIRKDGTVVPTSIAASPLTLGGQHLILGLFRDITERKRTEEALRQSKEFAENLIGAMKDGFSVLNDRGIHLNINAAMCHMTGFSREELLGTGPPHPYWPEEEYGAIEKTLRQALAGRSQDFELTFKRKNGERFPVIVSPSLLTDKNGHVICCFATVKDITERKRAEEALRESHEQLILALDAVSDGVWDRDYRTGTFRRSDQWYQLMGYGPDELAQWEAENGSIIRADDNERLVAATERHERGETASYRAEFRIRRGSGEWRWILGRGKIVERGPSGEPLRMVGTDTDITERKRAEEALRRSEEKYRATIDSMGDAIHVVDANLRIVLANRRFTEWLAQLGHDTEVVGRHLLEVVPFLPEVTRARYARVFESGEAAITEHTAVVDGREFITDVRKIPVLEDNRVVQVITVIRDITERKRAEEVLRESEKKYRDVVEMARDGIAIVQDGLVKYVNPRVTEMTGYSSEELIGTAFVDYVHPDDLAETIQSYERRMAGEEMPPVYEIRVRDTNGRYRHTEISGRVVLYEGKPADLAVVRDITERKGADEALKRSEREKAAVLDSMSELVVYQDPDMRIRWANRAAGESVDMAPEHMVGRHCYEIWQKRQKPCPDCPVEKAIRTGRCHEGDMTTPDGRIWHVRSFPVRDASGSIEGVVEVTQDITERKRAEEALRQSEDKYRSIVETTYDWVWEIDREGRHTYSNRSVESILGYGVSEFIELDAFELMHDEDRALVAEKLQQMVAQKRGWTDWVIRWRHKDGSCRFLQSNAVPILDTDGELIGFRGTDRDITERTRAEEALRDSEDLLRRVIDADPNGIFVKDKTGRYMLVNEAEAKLYGTTPSEMVGKTDAEFAQTGSPLAREANDFVTDDLAVIESGQAKFIPEEPFTLSDGTTRWFQTTKVPLTLGGRTECVLGVAVDITDRKWAEQERRELEAQVQHAQKLESLGVLAGGIAHDFNNLLAGVLGNADLALLDLPENSPARTCLEEIKAAGVRASDLTRQMLAYSGRGQFATRVLDLNQQVNEMAHLLRASISKKATIAFDLAEELGAIEADAAQIQQVVMNLITNASDAVGDRAGVITIRTRMVEADRAFLSRGQASDELPEGRYVLLEVTDTGPGIDAGMRTKVFDPFFTTKFAGRGLGLAAVLGIVRGHGGTIMIESEPGTGTTFTILFPCSTRPVEAPEHEVPTAPWRSTGTILVVDDEPLVSGVATRILEHAGFAVLTANRASEGVELFRAHADEITAVLLDMTMPEMSGAEVYHELRRTDPHVPVILTSGYNEQDAIGHFAADELAGFVHKPFEVDTLVSAVRRALER